MRASLRSGVAAACLALAGPALAAPQDLKAQADKLIAQSWAADGPGAAVVITDHGKIIYQGWRGLADVQAKEPITPATVFRLGSITKQFSAAVVLQLVAEGKLSLDDPLSKFYPDYPQPGASATVRQLLNHTSGVQSYTDIPGWMVEANTNRAYTTEQLMAVFKNLPSLSKPGETWAYNNSGYVLVGAIIEKVTGKAWHEAVRERIATPLHLTTLRYGVGEASVANMASGYRRGDDGSVQPAEKIHMSVPAAAGGLIGTVGDLAAWANGLHHGQVVDAASYKATTSPSNTADGKVNPYGFGLEMEDVRGHPTIGHGGGIFGFVTASLYIPERDVFVAVFTNSAPPAMSPGEVAQKLAMLAVGDAFPVLQKQPVDLKAMEPLLGAYKIEGSDDPRVLLSRGGKLFTRRSDSAELEVFPAGGKRFFYDGGMTWFDLKEGESGPVMEFYLNGSHKAELAKRVGGVPADERPFDVSRSTLELYVGGYQVGGAVAVVTLGDDGLSVKLGDQPTLRLIPRSETEFTVEKAGARVTFNGEAAGPAKSMTIHQGGRTMEAPRFASD